MTSLGRILTANFRKFIPSTTNYHITRCISTSKKNPHTVTVEKRSSTTEELPTTCEPKTKNWVSYGFSETDEREDRITLHVTMFLTISLCLVFGAFMLAYRPGDLERDWAQREGYLELRRREKEGLPLIDPDYIPLDQLILPTDEELGDTPIII